MASLAAVAAMNVPTRIVAYDVGFGVDAYHGVSYLNRLENVAALSAEGAFLGATALLKSMHEDGLYLDPVNAADSTTSLQLSIVNGSIVSGIEGHFGDHDRYTRTQGSKLFIKPLDLPLGRQGFDRQRLRQVPWRGLY
jgi:hypothetical protein